MTSTAMTTAGDDRAPLETIEGEQLRRFRAYFAEVCKGSRYYAEKLAELGLTPADISTFEDLRRLPALDTKTLLERNADLPAVTRDRLRRIIVSGGTTGRPKICFFADNMR